MAYQNVGEFNAGRIGSSLMGTGNQNLQNTIFGQSFSGKGMDAAIASGNAFLISELEKRDNLLRTPLTSVTYPRDIPVKVGGGWVEFITAMSVDYGVAKGSGDGLVHAPGADAIPVIQMNLERGAFKTHVFAIAMRIMFVDMQRSAITGRNLDRMLTDGIRLSYDKHMDQNVYIGMPLYGTTGLLNNPDVIATNVPNGAAGTSQWSTKTPDEILRDINTGLQAAWEAGGYSLDAMPNHILVPYEQYNYAATTRLSELADRSILSFILENNITSQNGQTLTMGATRYAKGIGAGNTDRMAIYRNDDRFVAVEELVPLNRVMTDSNTEHVCYDSAYMANLSEVELFYEQTMRYFDGI